jgi:peptidoglycan/xylan/chitin deacetylase (PgdA/CDA1 family)
MNLVPRFSISVLVLVLLIIFSSLVYSGDYGQLSIKKWADDRKSAFSFTFDDGCMSQYTYAAPILDSFGFKATFYVIIGLTTDDLPGIELFGTWKQYRAMALEGHEIASHTVNHPDLTTLPTGDTSSPGTLLYELSLSKNTIEQKITNQKCISIAYPGLGYDSNVVRNTSQFYESGRSGGNYPNDSSLTGLDFYKIACLEEYFNTPRNSPQDDLDELQDFESYLQGSIINGKWGILGAHEVVPFAQIPYMMQIGAWYPMSCDWLTSLCQWVKQRSDSNLVWVETVANITRYMKERESFQYNIIAQTSTQIQISSTDTLNNMIYNFPLTVDITVPSDWKLASVIQGTRIDTINTFTLGDSTYIRTHIIPDGGTLVLNKINPPVTLLSLSVLIQGLYNGSKTVSDTITVKLHNASFPYGIVDSSNGVLDTNGIASFTFTNAANGLPYYLSILHRNAIETWSSEGLRFTSSALNYDFTSSQNHAYGNNLVLKEGKYCLYSGDVNHDGLVDLADLIEIDNDNMNYVTGNVTTDINGDGLVDLNDLILVDNNNTNYITRIVPPEASNLNLHNLKSKKLKNKTVSDFLIHSQK